MSIVVKNIGRKKYAYLAYRHGQKVVHQYLGPLSDPKVKEKIKSLEAEKKIPEQYISLFWDTDSSKIDLRKNARYIIERVLEMGNLGAANWIQRLYPTQRILEICEVSRKISLKSKNFWRIWFDPLS